MHLVRVGTGLWTVLAIVDSRGHCLVLDELEVNGAAGERVLADLRETIPARGPRHNQEASRKLRDDILELREPTTHGGTLRVLYFYDRDRRIICCNCCLKKSDKTPEALIDQAVGWREAYIRDRDAGCLIIEELPDA